MHKKVQALQQTLSDAAKRSLDRRFGALYDKVYRWDVLLEAWERVRRNRGAPGIDGESIDYIIEEIGVGDFLRDIQQQLREERYRATPVKRCWIDKPGKPEKRPLGIPVVRDRVVQMAVKLVIEPIFETNFLKCSYGFRPGRSAHQAIAEIRRSVTFERRHVVVDADIKGFFDSIPHGTLLNLVQRRISDRRVLKLIKAWLRCGVMEDGKVRTQTTGTPQGGVISPLLANLYLHAFDKMWQESGHPGQLVRYADDFVILAWRGGSQILRMVRRFLARLGLQLNEAKTRVVHANQGFDFLGMTFRVQETTARAKRLKKCCYRWPRKKAQAALRERIRQKIGRRYSLSLQEVIREINPILRGWYNYFKESNAAACFLAIDRFVMNRLRIFVKRKHSDESSGFRRLAGGLACQLGLFQLHPARVSTSDNLPRESRRRAVSGKTGRTDRRGGPEDVTTARLLRHRQTKGPETDRPRLQL